MALHEYHGLYKEGQRIKGIIQGGKLVWPAQNKPTPPPGPDYTEPFYVKLYDTVSIGTTGVITIKKIGANAPILTIEYSTDKITWITLGTTSSTLKYNLTKRTDNDKVYFRCTTNVWGVSINSYNTISVDKQFIVGGNILSLFYGSNFTGEEKRFPTSDTETLVYFLSGTSIVEADKLLLPPHVNKYTYNRTFQNCTQLTIGPELPATTLQRYCYDYMFSGCTALTKAPELPATTLIEYCYDNMFRGCSSLIYVKCLGKYVSNCARSWLRDASATGTFYKSSSVTNWPRNYNGIPSGWTVRNV